MAAPETNDNFPIHVRTLNGLEGVLAEELTKLGAGDVHIRNRVVICEGDKRLLYQANLWCRTAIRVLKPLASFPAPDEKSLYAGVKEIDWSPWLNPTGTLAVDANVYSSFTTHSLFVAQLSKDAIVDQMREKTGDRPSVDLERPELRIVVSLFKDTAQVFVDSSGESLHKRGYRKETGDAPLSETLAAGILKLAEWDATTALVDPMCGSGTILIEAGLMAKNFAPGLLRRDFGFQRWKDYDATLFNELVAEARSAINPEISIPILGVEIDAKVAKMARENIKRAELSDVVTVENADFFSWNKLPEAPGTVVVNPPYDERLAVANIAELYQKMGLRFKELYQDWDAYFFTGNLQAVKDIGLSDSGYVELSNGSIDCRLYKYELHELIQENSARADDTEKWKGKAEVFSNRLIKNFKHYGKWARRENVACWRVYDWDIPEFPFLLDFYGEKLHFAEVPRNSDLSPLEQARYTQLMVDTAAVALKVTPENVVFKKRKPQRTGSYKLTAQTSGGFFEVTEGGHRFVVNLNDYLDVGLFLEHRSTRAWVKKEAKDKDFLNLYGYTGTHSVYAATGGAKSTITVDTASTYLEWAEKNFDLNSLSPKSNFLVRSDVLEFLSDTDKRFDLCVMDPPAKSTNRASGEVFDVQENHLQLFELVLARMNPGGKILFSTNYRNFKLDEAGIQENFQVTIKEVTSQMTPFDFQRKPSHRTWEIYRIR